MIFITGDTHGNIDYEKLTIFADESKKNGLLLTKNDYMIIAGDAGIVWSESTLKNDIDIYENLPFTVLYVDGNHENFDLLNKYPLDFWNGGYVHRISESIYHLTRGQVFLLENKSFFTFGGGTSIDKAYRREGIGWWRQEVPSREEIETGIDNLAKYDNKVDYIITHSIDRKTFYYPLLKNCGYSLTIFEDNLILDYFETNVDYTHWYFGHYHLDGEVNNKKTALYSSIIRII